MNFSFFAKNVYGRQNEQIEMPNCCFVSLVIAYSFLDGGREGWSGWVAKPGGGGVVVLPEGEDVDGVDLRGSINQGLWQNLEGKIVLGDPLLPDAVGQLMPRIVVGSSELWENDDLWFRRDIEEGEVSSDCILGPDHLFLLSIHTVWHPEPFCLQYLVRL